MDKEATALAVIDTPTELTRYETQLRVANAVRSFVLAKEPSGRYKHLTDVKGKLHCNIEVWRAIAATAGYALGVTEVRPCGDGWEADGVVRRVSDGIIVGSGSGYCDKLEKFGKGKDAYAIRGMAQTRAQSRAAAGVFGQLVVFIHEDMRATPAEEMTSVHPKDIDDGRVDDLPPPQTVAQAREHHSRSVAKLPKPVGQRARADHDAITGEVTDGKAVDEEQLQRDYDAAPNALARARVLQHVPSDVATRIKGRHRA